MQESYKTKGVWILDKQWINTEQETQWLFQLVKMDVEI